MNFDGTGTTVVDMAAYLGLAERTVRERIKKMGGEFTLDKGLVHLEPINTDLDPDL